ncbi:ferredoxin [Actinoplanes flavus]|uniref:Ferredoxin n=1 Tax=Actinoplanes flavus TaxID=2820290 RepID=A0ABS3URE6_9ACTN|nr:ferredoxin [Actinoplanes flavus]MBO3741358.1 ferredoxin [Actinoplanes flavus]
MTEQRWRIQIDKRTCIGSGLCIGISPDHFRLVDGRSEPRAESVTPDDLVLDAAEFCPVEAILVRAENTMTILAPQQ